MEDDGYGGRRLSIGIGGGEREFEIGNDGVGTQTDGDVMRRVEIGWTERVNRC